MALSVGPPRLRRHGWFVALLALFVPCSIFVFVLSPDMSGEQALIQRLAELQMRVRHLEAMHRARQEDVHVLTQHFSRLIASGGDRNMTIGPEARLLLHNVTSASGPSLRLPSVYHFLPHLLDSGVSLQPALTISRGRTGVSVVLGIPTVKRDVQSYLLSTLQNLVDCMSPEEQADTVIIVFIAETESEYVHQVAREIELQFPKEINSGLLEVISPPASYYPDFNNLRQTLGDPAERVRWRTKQNLDFAFLMMYAQPKGTFYVQLEDDILAKRGFIGTMKKFALDKIGKKEDWFVLDFCQLGFIGKMFKCMELPWLVQFFLMFYNDKPVDWLLEHLISTRICSLDKDVKHCKKAKDRLWVHYKPSLFQHIGTHSSLKGKVQKLKDKQYGKVPLFYPHANPPASVESGIKSYKQYTLARAYLGESFFWGLLPQPGDQLIFKFSPPILIKRYLFRSGNAEHPSDRFYNTTVEVLPTAVFRMYKYSTNTTNDGYVIAGRFDAMGIAEGQIDPKLGSVKVLRLTVHTESEKWAILSEIMIEPDTAR